MNDQIVFDNVSKFYGEVLGVNRVHLSIPPGITSLVGPNGSGKTTLMNLMTGLLQPTEGNLTVLGMTTGEPEAHGVAGRCVSFAEQRDGPSSGSAGSRRHNPSQFRGTALGGVAIVGEESAAGQELGVTL